MPFAIVIADIISRIRPKNWH